VPGADIQDIETAENDIDQELVIIEKPSPDVTNPSRSAGIEGKRWNVYREDEDSPGEGGAYEPIMLHYAINKPVGAKFGESDLGPLLRWLVRYASWLEDRARLNRYRNTFMFWVKARFTNKAEKLERQAELNRNPPNPGSILVTDESEEWSILSPKLASFEAAEDGEALKKMIAVGAGYPMHFLAEPESTTRTTAESAGGPTFRHLQQRQEFFLYMLEDIASVVVRRRKLYDKQLSLTSTIKATGTDISARDNAALAVAASTVIGSFSVLRDRGLIDDQELMRITYRFAGEVVDLEDLMKRGAAAPPPLASPSSAKSNGRPAGVTIDPIRGEPEGIDQPSPEM
jgi:hypothetical protein